MTSDTLAALRDDFARLLADAERGSGYVTAHLKGERDAPSVVPNIDGQRLVGQLKDVQRVLSAADVESDPELAVIGRRVVLSDADGEHTTYLLVIPGEGDPSAGLVSVESPVGRALYMRRVGDTISVEAPAGQWTATLVAIQ